MAQKTNRTRIRYDGVVEVELTRGQVALCDPEDWQRVKQYKWCASWGRTSPTFYAHSCLWKRNDVKKMGQMHRLILDAPAHLQVHHINGNGIDNRRCNLKLCTRAQNQTSSRKRKNTSSKYRGVNYRPDRKKWRATISSGGQFTHLGTFSTEVKAALAYNDAALECFGEFANLNEVEETYVPS